MVSVFNKGTAKPYDASAGETAKSGARAANLSTSVGRGRLALGALIRDRAAADSNVGGGRLALEALVRDRAVADSNIIAGGPLAGVPTAGLQDLVRSTSGIGIIQGGPLAGAPLGSNMLPTKVPDASQALEQLGSADAMSSIPAGPGGGNIDGFAKGDNCGRPSGDSSGTVEQSGIGEGAQPGAKQFVPPEALKNDPEFQAKLSEMKGKYPGLTDQQIYNVIGGESNFNSKAVNRDSGATGLFQFIPSTANSLGYNTGQIQNMTPSQQLAVYDQYLSKNNYKGGRLGIMQAAPAYANKPGNFEVYKQGTKAYAQNPGWRGPDGRITVDSINAYYRY